MDDASESVDREEDDACAGVNSKSNINSSCSRRCGLDRRPTRRSSLPEAPVGHRPGLSRGEMR